MIPPGDFLPVASAAACCASWTGGCCARPRARPRTGPSTAAGPVAVAVNLAGLLPGDPDFRATVHRHRRRGAACAWDRLVLELVETSLVDAARRTRWPRWTGWWRAACGSPSTTSAPATPRWPGSRSCRRRSSRWTGRSSPASAATRPTSRWPARWSTWPGRWAAPCVAEGVETDRAVPRAARRRRRRLPGVAVLPAAAAPAAARGARAGSAVAVPAASAVNGPPAIAGGGNDTRARSVARGPTGLTFAPVRRPARRRR